MDPNTNSDNVTNENKELSTKPYRNGTLRSKEFFERNSLLEDLLKNEHIATVYNLFVVLLIGAIINLSLREYIDNGEINFGQKLIIKSFVGFYKFAWLWICLFFIDFLVYYGFKYWATVRTKLVLKSSRTKPWDYCCMAAFIVYLHCRLWISTWITLKQDLSIFLGMVMTCEITRMLMKLYAFVRSNVPRVIKYKPTALNEKLYPTMSEFTYFIWVPTLVYRDSYPMTENIRWKNLCIKVLELIGGMVFTSIVLEQYLINSLKDYGKKPYYWTDIATLFTENAVCGMLVTFSTFYLGLHVWMGAFAEICRFGDRLFYEDWWTSSNHETFFRKWNIIVHDWLYTYIFKDIYEIVVPGNKTAARIAVFLISGIFHEYILYTCFGFVLPIAFLLFCIGGATLTFIKIKPHVLGNIMVLYVNAIGNGIIGTVYVIEFFSRVNCPIENPTVLSYLVPRLFSCNAE